MTESKVPHILLHATLVLETFIHAVAQILPLLPPSYRCKYFLESVARSKDITAPPCLVPFFCCHCKFFLKSFCNLKDITALRLLLYLPCRNLTFHILPFLLVFFSTCCIPDANYECKDYVIIYQSFFLLFFWHHYLLAMQPTATFLLDRRNDNLRLKKGKKLKKSIETATSTPHV